MLLLRSFVASGIGNSTELVEKSSNRCTGNVVVSASSNVEVVVIVVVVSSVCSVGELSTISILSRDILLFEIDKLFLGTLTSPLNEVFADFLTRPNNEVFADFLTRPNNEILGWTNPLSTPKIPLAPRGCFDSADKINGYTSRFPLQQEPMIEFLQYNIYSRFQK